MRKTLASRLRKRVSIEAPIRTSDGAGGFTESWNNFVTVFAAITPITGREKLVGFKMQGEMTHSITIRYVAGITSKMRVSLGGRVFNIRAVINQSEASEKLTLLCDEGAGV